MKKFLFLFIALSLLTSHSAYSRNSESYFIDWNDLPEYSEETEDSIDEVEIVDHVDESEERLKKMDIGHDRDKIITATSKMAVIIAQFSESKPDYKTLVDKMIINIERNGLFKGLVEPSLKLMDSMLASNKGKNARLVLTIIREIDPDLSDSLERELNLAGSSTSSWNSEYVGYSERKMYNFLNKIDSHEGRLDFGNNTVSDYDSFQDNFTDSIKRSLRERAGFGNIPLDKPGLDGDFGLGITERGPIFGSTGIDTIATRDQMQGFLDACNEGCDDLSNGGQIIGGVIGGALGIPGGPAGVGAGILAGAGIGGFGACTIGCASGIAGEVIDTYDDIGGQLDDVTGFTGSDPHNPHGEPGHQPTMPTIPTAPTIPTTPDLTATPTIPTTPTTTEDNDPNDAPSTETSEAPAGCDPSRQTCENKDETDAVSLSFGRDFYHDQLDYGVTADIKEVTTPLGAPFDDINNNIHNYETDFNPERYNEITTPTNENPFDNYYDEDRFDPGYFDDVVTPSPINGGGFGDYNGNGGSGLSGGFGGGFGG